MRSSGPLALLASRYGLWVIAAVSAGVVSGSLIPTEVPVPVILAALFGLGIWLADINRRNRCGRGAIGDTLLGVLISAVMFKWSYIAAVIAGGHSEELRAVLPQLAQLD
jgi:hypothetical protein